MKTLIKISFAIIVILFGASFFLRGKLPDQKEILEELYQEPIQTKEYYREPFTVRKEGIEYTIEPLYEYKLYGLIVSYNLSQKWYDYYHERWKDYLNIKDLCVIWGDNVKTDIYKKIIFTSGSFTCYTDLSLNLPPETLNEFNQDNLSNNHLLVDNERTFELILKAEKGDQIYLEGYLAKYSHSDGQFQRGTSITRTDRGDGACETIYVTDFKILKEANPPWRSVYLHTKYLIIIYLALFFIYLFFWPHKSIRE